MEAIYAYRCRVRVSTPALYVRCPFFSWQARFSNIEAIMATRISLVRSARQKEQRLQIGDLTSPFCDALLELEKASLLCLSERARNVHQSQIALNSVTRAQKLEQSPSSDVSQEFANVMWLTKEHKIAVQSLDTLVSSHGATNVMDERHHMIQHAILLAQLVSDGISSSIM